MNTDDKNTPQKLNITQTAKEREKQIKLMAWFNQEMQRQSINRHQMAIDEDYYDSVQWQPDEAAEVEGRGQNPVVYNEIKPTIDWLIGVERRTRTDFNIIARDEESIDADEDAKNKTKLLKYINDANRAEFERSHAADDTFKAGLGWIEIGINPDPEEEPIYVRTESWRNMLYDSLGTRRDLDDTRYLFRFRMVDLDIAIAYFPKREGELRAACVTGSSEHYMEYWNNQAIEDREFIPMQGKYALYDSDAWGSNQRERVMLIEAWYKEPTNQTRGGTSSVDRIRMDMRCTIITEKHLIMDVASPYKHNKYPFVPLWAYRRKRDNAPYGPIRPVRGPQDSLNKRMSKALFVLSTNQVIAEVGAFSSDSMSPQEVRDELRAPDGFAILAKDGLNKLKVSRENDVATGHLNLAQADQAIIRNASGISSENLGRDTNITAGIALKQKAEQGGQLTAELFDNLLFARQLEGELTLSLIEQFYDQPKIFSIEGETKKRDYTRINQPDPNNPGQKLNDVTARQAQFIIGEQAWKQSLQQAAFESLMQLMTTLAPAAPQLVMGLLDTVFELADIPNKRVILQRIRQITGQDDPDTPPTPEQKQAMQQKQAIAQKQQDAQMAQLDAEIAKAKATGGKLEADSLETTMKAMYVAMQAAQAITTTPAVTPVADELLKSAGFVDKNGGNIAPPAQQGMQGAPGMQQGASGGPPGAPDMQQSTTDQPPADPTGQTAPMAQPGPQNPMLANGAQAGIETMTGADNTQGQ